MICQQCNQERTRCRCAPPAQARLLAPPPAWKRELQERVEAYRARHHGAAPPRAAATRVLEFRGTPPGPSPSAAPPPPPIHSQTLAVEEPLADPVLPLPRPAPVAPPSPRPSPFRPGPPATPGSSAA